MKKFIMFLIVMCFSVMLVGCGSEKDSYVVPDDVVQSAENYLDSNNQKLPEEYGAAYRDGWNNNDTAYHEEDWGNDDTPYYEDWDNDGIYDTVTYGNNTVTYGNSNYVNSGYNTVKETKVTWFDAITGTIGVVGLILGLVFTVFIIMLIIMTIFIIIYTFFITRHLKRSCDYLESQGLNLGQILYTNCKNFDEISDALSVFTNLKNNREEK